MRNTNFNVTFEIVTPESAENGEAEKLGFIEKNVNLRGAICAVKETRTAHVDGVSSIEANVWPSDKGNFNWITITNGMEYLTGAHESRSIHIPENITPSSRNRILRLLTA